MKLPSPKFWRGLARHFAIPALGLALFLVGCRLMGVPPLHVAGIGVMAVALVLVFAWAATGGEF